MVHPRKKGGVSGCNASGPREFRLRVERLGFKPKGRDLEHQRLRLLFFCDHHHCHRCKV